MLGLLLGLLRRAVAAFMVLFIFFPCGVTVNKMTVQNPDEIRLNVSIISDGHMEGNNAARFKRPWPGDAGFLECGNAG